MNTLKKFDIVIIILLIVFSFTPYLIFSKTWAKSYSSTYANITISGKLYESINLSSSNYEEPLVITTPHGKNTISIKDNTIKIVEADCHDELCVKQGDISKVGQSLICLPHKLIIEIKGDESESEYDDMILSH